MININSITIIRLWFAFFTWPRPVFKNVANLGTINSVYTSVHAWNHGAVSFDWYSVSSVQYLKKWNPNKLHKTLTVINTSPLVLRMNYYYTSMWIRAGIFWHTGIVDKNEFKLFDASVFVFEMLFFVSISKTFSWLFGLIPDPSWFSTLVLMDDEVVSLGEPLIRKQKYLKFTTKWFNQVDRN